MAAYDRTNVFARILRGEIPCKKVLESDHSLAFADISPKAPVHVLVIPRGEYIDHSDFARKASPAEIADFARAVADVAALTGVDGKGHRVISNSGADGGQEVPHYHVHVLGGRRLGAMLAE
jgi:diadenosine tetraphosphate (Ap4A) HIT family hydrolase